MEFEHVTRVNEYGFYCVPSAYAKREIPRILAAGDVYEPATLKLMQRMVGRGSIITGGAFIGDFFPALSSALSPKARLISFEPHPMNRAAALETIRLNGLSNIELAPVAVSDEPGTLHLQTARSGGEETAARAKIVESADDGETTPVDVVTIDSLVAPQRKITILHLDVEGHEKSALLGAQRTISTHAPMIVLEAERPWQRNMYTEFLNMHFPDQSYRLSGWMERNVFFLAGGA